MKKALLMIPAFLLCGCTGARFTQQDICVKYHAQSIAYYSEQYGKKLGMEMANNVYNHCRMAEVLISQGVPRQQVDVFVYGVVPR